MNSRYSLFDQKRNEEILAELKAEPADEKLYIFFQDIHINIRFNIKHYLIRCYTVYVSTITWLYKVIQGHMFRL